MPENKTLESPRIVTISDVVKENKDVKTIRFMDPMKAFSGQFVMVWIPGVDEVPMSLSYLGEEKGITVKRMGEATRALQEFKPGARIGIRGPHGTHFETERKNILVVAGGIGIAPLAPFIERSIREGKNVALAFGAKSAQELLFLERLEQSCNKIHLATDDGSKGYHGFVSDLAEEILEKENFDAVLTCGPEIMMKKVVDISRSRSIPVRASLERYMKCGVGICDSCAINGHHVCINGPVFEGEKLVELKDFGKFRRDASGRIEQL